MADISYPYREDRSCSGFFEFTNTQVQYADTGIKNLRHYAQFDQGGWLKSDASGQSSYGQAFDATTSRVYDALTSVASGTYSLRRRLLLPRDFGSFTAVSLLTRRSATTITSLKITLLNAGVADPTLANFSVLPTDLNTWQAFSEEPTGNYSAGDLVTLVVECIATAADVSAWVGDWSIGYLCDKVNG